MKTRNVLATSLALCLICWGAPALAAGKVATAMAIDQGAVSGTAVSRIALLLKPTDAAAMRQLMQDQVDPSSASYGKFLTPAQVKARFGRSDAEVAALTQSLAAAGLTVDKVYGSNLVIAAHGSNARLVQLFGTPLHNFTRQGKSYQAPVGKLVMPASLSSVAHVAGLDTRPIMQSHRARVPQISPEIVDGATVPAPVGLQPNGALTTNMPGSLGIGDFAAIANLNPVYARGYDGKGRTLGILTYANFDIKDVQTFWTTMGVNSDTSRVTVVNASGPDGVISADGAIETTLDVEQAGGVAPGARIIVYEAVNDDLGTVALLAAAANDNLADVLSMSWGLAENFYTPEALAGLETMLMQLAVQGTPLIASSGDTGAYEINNAAGPVPTPSFSAELSVDYPASSPTVLAAGGTTLPVTLTSSATGMKIIVPEERAWGYDYLRQLFVSQAGQSGYYNVVFPQGGGGGVSYMFPVPAYQQNLPGTKVTQPGQFLLCVTPTANVPCTPGEVLDSVPAGYAGRNVPDVSFNADSFTGYYLHFNGAWQNRGGGTSFVAPQLNGVFTVITQQAGKRLGWLQPTLYSLFRQQGYAAGSPFKAVKAGNNWGYSSTASYNPATGLGKIDADALAKAIAPVPAPVLGSLTPGAQ